MATRFLQTRNFQKFCDCDVNSVFRFLLSDSRYCLTWNIPKLFEDNHPSHSSSLLLISFFFTVGLFVHLHTVTVRSSREDRYFLQQFCFRIHKIDLHKWFINFSSLPALSLTFQRKKCSFAFTSYMLFLSSFHFYFLLRLVALHIP